jgi:Mn2+/Fe2+ NRAMP family transporter
MSGNKKIVGEFRLPGLLRIVGWVATVVMLLATAAFFASTFLQRNH